MNKEQELLEKWRKLPQEKQQQVLNLVESLEEPIAAKETALGSKLRQIRAKIEASGQPLLNAKEIELEVIDRRGGVVSFEE